MVVTRGPAGHFIAGVERTDGDAVFTRVDPADARIEVGQYVTASDEQLHAAIEAACSAASAWRRTPGPSRAQVLHRAATLLEGEVDAAALEITLEEGKTLGEARAEVLRTVSTIRHAAEQARAPQGHLSEAEEPGTMIATTRRPLGVVGLITPWNFPLAIPARKGAPALAFGNTVVLKPSSLTPGPALRLARILHAAGLPPGCWNVVVGPGKIGRALACDQRVGGVSFTGSTEVGKSLESNLAERGAPFQGEMGGNSPVVAFADAEPQRVAEIVTAGAFISAGQICTATRRVIVDDAVYDAVLRALILATEALRLGPGRSPSAEVCPLIAIDQRDEVARAVERAVASGARLLCGGEVPDGDLSHGAFFTPALLGDVTGDMEIATTEVFGPVCSILRATDAEHALRLANDGPFGLSASVVTRDIGKALEFMREIEAGMVHINRQTVGADPHMPFGGMKDSARGPREQGLAARDFFTREQTIYLRP